MDFFSATSDKIINTIKKELFDVAAGAPIVGHDHPVVQEMMALPAPVKNDIGGQNRADFFKSLHESAKSASGRLFADFLQTFFMKCRLLADFLQTFSVDHLLSCTLFAHFLQQMIQGLQTSSCLHAHLFCICRLFAEHLYTFCREHDSILQTSCTSILDLMQT